jgi:hypothetical protein
MADLEFASQGAFTRIPIHKSLRWFYPHNSSFTCPELTDGSQAAGVPTSIL